MKNREESKELAKENRIRDINDKITLAVGQGLFETNAEMDYVQSEIISNDPFNYTIEDLGKSKRNGMHMYKITWD